MLHNKDLLIISSFTDVINLSNQFRDIITKETLFFNEKKNYYKTEKEIKFILEFSEDFKILYEKYCKEYELLIESCKIAIKKTRRRECLSKVHHIQIYDWAHLLIYDIESKSLLSSEILSSIFKNMTEYSFIAQIPEKLFVLAHERVNNVTSGFMCTLDTDTKEAKFLCKGNYNFNLNGIYYKKSIYMFGGSTNSNASSTSIKYNLSTNTIEPLQNLPNSAEFCSLLIINEKILITGYEHTNIYEYDPKYDSYLVPNQKFVYGHKALTTDYKRVYLFESNGGIWQSEECYLEGWSYVCSNNIKWDHFSWRFDNEQVLIFTSDFRSRIANDSSPEFRNFKFDLKKKEVIFGFSE